MKAAIMQPYFLPYIGYYQLIAAVDKFVVYDNIKYTKKGWINRNRMLQNGKDVMFSIPLRKGSDYLDVRERELSPEFNRTRLLNQIDGAYRRAPYFEQTYPLIERVINCKENNLFSYIHRSITEICSHLAIPTEIISSSGIDIDHELKGQGKVLALCKAVGADVYINAIGGVELYTKDEFRAHGIDLKFIKPKTFEYRQFDNEFVPWLSIIDVMMFNSLEEVELRLNAGYELQ